MKSLYLAKAFLFIAASMGLIGLIQFSVVDFFSLPTLMLIGITLISLDLAIHLKPNYHVVSIDQSYAEEKSHHFFITKVGLIIFIVTFLIQSLMQ